MSDYEEILAIYHHLLMLDDDKDKEKQWIISYEPKAKGLSTFHLHILSYLLKHENPLGKEISKDLSVLQGTLSKRLTLLIKRQFVKATKDEKDGRGKHYSLTSEGKQLAQIHEQLLSMKNKQLAKQLENFAPEELKIILRFLRCFKSAEETIHYPTDVKNSVDRIT